VLAFAAARDIPVTALSSLDACARLIDEGGSSLDLRRDPLVVDSLKDVERAFEDSLGRSHRRSEGAVYTPDYIIDYLLSHAIASTSASADKVRVIDPACGSGGFLVRAAVMISAMTGSPLSTVVSDQLFGVDKDPRAVQYSQVLLDLLCLAHRERPATATLETGDSLITPAADLGRAVGVDGGFDVVATNPPYVKLQNLPADYRATLTASYRGLASGNFSLALLYVVQAHRLIRDGGVAALITQNNLYTSLAAQQTRAYLRAAGALRRIVDFGHQRVFPRASAYTCLVFLGKPAKSSFEFGSVSQRPSASSLAGAQLSELSTATLADRKWRLGRPEDLDNLARLETQGTPLGQACEIKVGFATLKDRVFLLGSTRIARLPDGTELEIEPALLRPAAKVSEVSSDADLPDRLRQVIFPYVEQSPGRFRPLDEYELRSQFSNGLAYLLAWRDELARRDNGAPNGRQWFEWGRRQSLAAPGPKLLTKTFSSTPRFVLDPSDALFCNGYSVRPRGEWAHRISLLQLLLESKVMHYYASLTSFAISGGYHCYQKNFIEPFCLPDVSSDLERELLAAAPEIAQVMIAALFGIAERDLEHVLTLDDADSPTAVLRDSWVD
jgi:hypothetical protein